MRRGAERAFPSAVIDDPRLEAEGRSAEAREVEGRFEEAWRYADVELDASRL